MTRIIFPAILLLALQHASSQDFPSNLILTEDQNRKWLFEVEGKPLPEQLQLIADRILQDTNVYVKTTYAHGARIAGENNEGKVESFGRPLIVLGGPCKHFLVNIRNATSPTQLKRFARLLTEKNIATVELRFDTLATAIYGARAVPGLILLTIRKKKTCRQIREIDFGNG